MFAEGAGASGAARGGLGGTTPGAGGATGPNVVVALLIPAPPMAPAANATMTAPPASAILIPA